MNKKLNKLETNLQQINDWNDEIIFLADDSNLLVGNASFLLDYSQDKNKVSSRYDNFFFLPHTISVIITEFIHLPWIRNNISD